jgi:methionine-rich copper-binding protein CopC
MFLRPAGRAAGYFDRAVELDAVELPNLEANYKAEPFVAFSAEAGEPAPLSRTWPGGYGGWALTALGVLMLLLAAMDSLRSRPAYVASVPIAGASLTTAPRTIQVTFSGALDPASTLSLVYVPAVPSENDISRDVGATSRLAPGDAERRTLEVIPPRLSTGLYLVRWVAYSESGGVTRHGSFAFGLGVAVPADDRSDTYSLRERASGERGRRFTVLGGVLLLGMGALIWYRAGLTGS